MPPELTPVMFHSWRVIAFTKDAVYIRLPKELQRNCQCSCDHCQKDPERSKWDTLVVPTRESHTWNANFTYTVHMPDGAVGSFLAHCAKNNLL